MITPQEAQSRVFSKASFGGGYNMGQVDAFLDEVIGDYAALYKENAALKGKMKVLAEKLEEYRATEDAMRRTLLSAQKMADSMVKEAEIKKTDAISKADAQAKNHVEEIRRELSNEEMRLLAARNATTAYVNKLKELYTHELEYIGRLSEMTVAPAATGEEDDPVKEIGDKVSEMMEAAQAESILAQSKEESAEAPAPVEDDEAVRRFPQKAMASEDEYAEEKGAEHSSDTVVFDRLQFGKDYQFE